MEGFDLDPEQADLAQVQEGLVVVRVKERVDLGLRAELRGDWGLLNRCLKLRVLVDPNSLGTLNNIRNKVLQLQEARDSDPLRIRHSLEHLVIFLRTLHCARM